MGVLTFYDNFRRRIGSLLEGAFTDTILLVEGVEIPVHKCILAVQSEYFSALFFPKNGSRQAADQRGAASSSQAIVELDDASIANQQSIIEITDNKSPGADNVVKLKNTKVKVVTAVLEYFYRGEYDYDDDVETHLLALELAHQFKLRDIEETLSRNLAADISAMSFSDFYNMKMRYKNAQLQESCVSFLKENGEEIAKSDNFSKLTRVSLLSLLDEESFAAAEIDIFRAAERWAGVNKPNRKTVKDIVEKIRLATMSLEDLIDVVEVSQELPSIDIREPFRSIAKKDAASTNFRQQPATLVRQQPATLVRQQPATLVRQQPATLVRQQPATLVRQQPATLVRQQPPTLDPVPDLNVAQSSLGAVVLSGSVTVADLISGSSGCTSHKVGGKPDCIAVKLDKTYRLNAMQLLLDSSEERSYKYHVEVSVDEKEWLKVVDHSNYWCRSHQFLRFDPRAVRFIRMTGTDECLNIISFAALYTKEECSLVQGIPVASTNVALDSRGAKVSGGFCGNSSYKPMYCIDGKENSSAAVRESSPLTITLGQPHWLSSLRVKINAWGTSYSIESSSDGKSWQPVGGETQWEVDEVWRTFEFSRRVVLHFRVTVKTISDPWMHLYHFESPASTTAVTN